MPEWLKKKLRKGGARNPYAVMNAAGIEKGDNKKAVSRKMGRAARRRKKRGITAGQAAASLVALLLALFPAAVEAQSNYGNFAYSYDVESTTATYCSLRGQNNSAFSAPIPRSILIETSGSSTTVTAVTAGTNPFAGIVAGDVIFVQISGSQRDVRVVTAKATDDSLTVDTAADWSAGSGYPFSWLDLSCGTGADDGWLTVEQFATVQMSVAYAAGDLGALDIAFFCKESGLGATAVRVYPGPSSDCGDGTLSGAVCQFSTTGQGLTYKIPHNAFAQCRVSLAYSTSDGGTRESVHATISGR